MEDEIRSKRLTKTHAVVPCRAAPLMRGVEAVEKLPSHACL